MSQYGLMFWPYVMVKSDCRDSFSSYSENIDAWSESGSKLEVEILEEQSQNVLFAFEPVGYLGETDISRSLTNRCS